MLDSRGSSGKRGLVAFSELAITGIHRRFAVHPRFLDETYVHYGVGAESARTVVVSGTSSGTTTGPFPDASSLPAAGRHDLTTQRLCLSGRRLLASYCKRHLPTTSVR